MTIYQLIQQLPLSLGQSILSEIPGLRAMWKISNGPYCAHRVYLPPFLLFIKGVPAWTSLITERFTVAILSREFFIWLAEPSSFALPCWASQVVIVPPSMLCVAIRPRALIPLNLKGSIMQFKHMVFFLLSLILTAPFSWMSHIKLKQLLDLLMYFMWLASQNSMVLFLPLNPC